MEMMPNNNVTHCVKSWPEYFEATEEGLKTFDVRINDRDFQVGDTLILQEWNPSTAKYSRRELRRTISYILQGEFGLPDNVCVLALQDEKY